MRSERLKNKEEFRNWLAETLRAGPTTIVFTKKDGTEREMMCSTMAAVIPEDKQPKGTGSKTTSTESHAVFDMIKQEWRSFRYADVNSVQVGNTHYPTKGEYNGLVD